jgi:predicted transcriptional regulator
MPAIRDTRSTRQLTLTGKPALPQVPKASSSKPKKLAPERVDTDAILSIKPEFAQLIADRKKNYEYRRYKMRETLMRIWLLETAPASAITYVRPLVLSSIDMKGSHRRIRYVMETSKPKTPGQVQDSTGIGNDDFDKGLKESKYGYPVLGLYKLKEPLTTTVLKSEFGISPPQGLVYVTKKMMEARPIGDMEKVY